MKPNRYLVALMSVAAISGGTLLYSASASALPCALAKFKSNQALSGDNPSSTVLNQAKIGKAAGGAAVLGGLAIGGVMLSRRRQQKNSATPIANSASAMNDTYKALEFPPSLPPANDVDLKRDMVNNRN